MDAALADPDDRWVVQQLATIPVREFPVLGPTARVHAEPFYTVMGSRRTKTAWPILARASQKQVVNVAQHGGLCGVLVSRSRPRPSARRRQQSPGAHARLPSTALSASRASHPDAAARTAPDRPAVPPAAPAPPRAGRARPTPRKPA